MTSAAEAIKRIKSTSAAGTFDAGQSLLPAFPVGYILAKDILIKISKSSSSSSIDTKALSEQASVAGGMLCFSFSHASSSSNESSHVHMEHRSDGMVMKIPGPQILGYVMQLTPRDQSRKYEFKKIKFDLPNERSPADTDSSSTGPQHAIPPPLSTPVISDPPKTDKESPKRPSHDIGPNNDIEPRAHADLPNAKDTASRPTDGAMHDILSLAKDAESFGLVAEIARALNH